MTRDERGVTPQSDDFSAWYNELVTKAGLVERGPDGDQVTSCFSWDAEPLDSLPTGTATLQTAGQLLTMAIDSGQPRCRWHRVRVDADVPARTSVLVAVATSEDPTPPGTIAELAPDGFPAGPPPRPGTLIQEGRSRP